MESSTVRIARMPMPFDPRDPIVSDEVPQIRRPLPLRFGPGDAFAQVERQRKGYVEEAAKTSARDGLQAIVDLYPEALQVIDKYLALEDTKGCATMARTFRELLAGGGR